MIETHLLKEEKQAIRLYLEWDELSPRNRQRRLKRLPWILQDQVWWLRLQDLKPQECGRIVNLRA